MHMRIASWLMVVMAFFMAAGGYAQAQDASGFSDLPPPCGDQPISIARMQWPSGAVLAHIHAEILAREYGCEVQVVAGDLSATGSSMATTQQPAVAPEMWNTRIAEVWNSALETQNVRQAGPTFSGDALEGWFIPDFVAQNHPKLTSAAMLKDYWQVFAMAGGKARFVSCPPDWACALINRNMLKALGIDDLFEIIEPANRFELDTLIGEAMSTKEPILFYYWQPNAVLAQFDFRQLDMGGYDAQALGCLAQRVCDAPVMSSFASEPVVIALAEWVFTDAPQISGYFQRAQMPLAEMNALLAWQSEQSKTAEETAVQFVETRADIWRSWLGLF